MKRQKETFTIENISEDLREAQEPMTDGEDFSQIRKTQVTFKKVFKGFDETEVLQYIEEQEEAYKSACSMYDRTIEDSKSENVLLRRENKALKQSVAELEAQVVELQGAAQEETETFEAEEQTEAPDVAETADFEAKIANLEAEIARYAAAVSDAQAKADALESENAALKADTAKDDEIAASAQIYEQKLADKEAEIEALNAKLAQAGEDEEGQEDVLRSEIDSLTKQIEGLNADVEAKAEAYEKAVADLEAFKRESGDSVIKAEVFSKQAEKLSAELSELRTVNQKQAYDYAEKLSTLEASTSADRARVSQQMKMHTYHLQQIDSLLSQVTEQFAMAKEAVETL